MRQLARIASSDSKAERKASEVAARARQRASPRGEELTTATRDGTRSLTTAGRAHFEPLVGAPLDRARIQVGTEADRVTDLAHATALTHRDNIYIPSSRFAPETATGYALLAHELAHVPHAAAAPGTVFREPKAHYPSEDEQKELEKILGRQTQVVPAEPQDASSTPSPSKVVDARKTMSPDEVTAMADRLVPVFERALSPFETTGEPDVVLPDAKSAVENTQRALDAIYKKFGTYVETKVAITNDPTLTTPQLAAAHQVSVTYGWDPDEPKTFAVEIMLNFCPDCAAALRPYTTQSQMAVRAALETKLMANPALWKKVEIAAKHSVGGSHTPGTHKIRLTPYGKEPYPNAVHELLHEFTHPAFAAAFDQATTEAFTEYFTEEIVGKPADKPANTASGARTTKTYDLSKMDALRGAMGKGPLNWQGDSPEESLRQAYFKGRLDLIGFRGTESEEKMVTAAGGQVWDLAVAAKELAERNARMLAAQAPHSNVAGVGVYFPTSGGSMLGIRYARVLYTRNPPFASSQLYLEGQVLATITGTPRRAGASVGLGFERQEPSYYYGVGGRALATSALSGQLDPTVAVQPFIAAGFRAMHYVRVGAEGFALIPVLSVKDTAVGATVTLGVEW
jgi:hypothetical protein